MKKSRIGSKKTESATRQSAAEFFSEHQQIAGFDNPAKSLFTTIREFVSVVAVCEYLLDLILLG